MWKRRSTGFFVAAPAIMFWLVSCSFGPAPPKMGTPEWYWAAANEQFNKGDLVKTQEHLEKIMASDNPFKHRATTWHLVVLAGMAHGYKALAEAYDAGEKQSQTQAVEFRRVVNDMQRLSRQYSMGLAQGVDRLQKESVAAQQLTLEFPFPHGNQVESVTLDRARKGIFPSEAERESAERWTVARGVMQETASAVGAGTDTAKAAEMFKTQPVEVPRAVFLLGVGDSLYEQSAIFDRRKLNEPDKKKLLLEMASDCLKPAAESDDQNLKKKAKDLQAKIEKDQKALPKG
ncbi:MAG: hypothetical protein HY236_07725 [Acidobacteria bacterium]|nr:hypothetical protein [Acidobacteriota bacterium]